MLGDEVTLSVLVPADTGAESVVAFVFDPELSEPCEPCVGVLGSGAGAGGGVGVVNARIVTVLFEFEVCT